MKVDSRRAGGSAAIQVLVVVAIVALLTAWLLPAIERTRQAATLALCKDHLRQIGVGLGQYAQENSGDLPVSPTVENPHVELIASLSAAGRLGEAGNYYCPAALDIYYTGENLKSGIIGYYYYSAMAASANPALSKFLRGGVAFPRELNLSMSGDTWVMSDIWVSGLPTAHAGYRKGLNYLMLDGSVGFVGESPRQAFH